MKLSFFSLLYPFCAPRTHLFAVDVWGFSYGLCLCGSRVSAQITSTLASRGYPYKPIVQVI